MIIDSHTILSLRMLSGKGIAIVWLAA